jgi:Na+(H+)/acetate symporter ActP
VPAAATADGKAPTQTQTQAFDIAKFAGIFAALGMAVGMIGTALTALFKGIFALAWWQLIAAFVGILLVISGPAMVMAWLKLRRRNIAPLLNANGWAVNAASKISIPFGETLTDVAKFPKMRLKDPYAKKGMPAWKKWVISLSVLAVVVGGLWLGNLLSWAGASSPLPRFHKTEIPADSTGLVVTETLEVADTTVVAAE